MRKPIQGIFYLDDMSITPVESVKNICIMLELVNFVLIFVLTK
jgi:hypothetical protein